MRAWRRRGPRFGPGRERLLVDGRDVAPVAVARTTRERRRGLLGTSGVDGALWITRCPSVHMVGMRYPIDVAVLDRSGVVLLVLTLRPWVGATLPRWRAAATVEAGAGTLAGWGVERGSVLSVGSVSGVGGGARTGAGDGARTGAGGGARTGGGSGAGSGADAPGG